MKYRLPVVLLTLLMLGTCFAADKHFRIGGKQPVRLHRGEKLLVELDVNGGTGYTWAQAPGRKDRHLTLLSTETVAKDAEAQNPDHPIAGGPELVVFHFKARRRGTARLKFIYGRPWMLKKGQAPTKTVSVVVRVR